MKKRMRWLAVSVALGWALVVLACASASVPASFECTPNSCAIVLVDNATTYSTRSIQINGYAIRGSIPMESAGRFFVPRSVLRESGKCAVVTVRLENGQHWISRSECAYPNEYFFLVIAAPLSASSFTPLRMPN